MNLRNLWDTLKGKKTGLFFGLTLLLGLANMAGFSNWQPTVEQTEAIAIILSAAGLLFRYLTRFTYN